MSDGSIAAIVPVWNRRELIGPVLRTLRAQTAAVDETIVVDDGSTDGAGDAAEEAGARVLRMPGNGGFARSVNRGIEAAQTEWVAVLNNDVTLAPDYLARLQDAAKEAEAWFATGRICAAGTSRIDATYDVLSRGGCAWRAGNGEPDGEAFDAAQTIYAAPWTAVLLRRALFDRVGPLEESFGSYLEDVDFGARCARARCPGVYVPGARAWHQASATLGAWSPAMVRLIARNQVWVAARHLRGRDWWHIAVGQVLWGALAVRHGAGAAWIRGKWEGLRAVPRVPHTVSRGEEKAAREWLRENERVVRRARSSYWRLYSLLTPGEAK